MARRKSRAKATPAPSNIQLSFFTGGLCLLLSILLLPLAPPRRDATYRCQVCGQPIKVSDEKVRW
nr:MAG TPA: zinc-ribbon family protein [Caudoviricetes sp.]